MAACASAPPAKQPVANHVPAGKPRDLEVSLERTLCFGTCPAYVVTIHADGAVELKRTKDAGASATATVKRVPPDQLDRLDHAIAAAKFFDIPADGPPHCRPTPDGGLSCTSCSDTSHSIVTVARAGIIHRVDNDHCITAPELSALEQLIDELAGVQ